MKGKILTLIIGILVGAIIATVGFLVYSRTRMGSLNNPEKMEMRENGQMGEQAESMGNPPEKPSEENEGNPPEKPSKNSEGETSEKTNEENKQEL